MTTYAERKQARIAAGPQAFIFEVVAKFPISGDVLGRFDSRKAAEDFAFGQRGPIVGNTLAMQMLGAMHKNEHISSSQSFSVVRVVKV